MHFSKAVFTRERHVVKYCLFFIFTALRTNSQAFVDIDTVMFHKTFGGLAVVFSQQGPGRGQEL